MRFCNRNLFLLYTLAVASFESIEATISRRIQTKSEGCVAQAVAWLPEDPRNVPATFKHLTFECELDPIDAEGEIGRMLELDLTVKQEEEFKSLMADGGFIPNSSILTFNSNSNVFGTSGDEELEVFEDIIHVPPGVTISSFLKKGTRPDNRQRNRRLGDAFGDSPTLVIKTYDTAGRTVPESTQELSNYVFGPESVDSINARNQFSACSAGKFDLSPGNFGHGDNADHTPGVIEVNMGISLEGKTQADIRDAILSAANAKLGFNLPGQYEFTLYTIEDCYDGCGWAAYAYYNSHLSMYRKSYASYPAVVLHELGHNFGLGHSGETITYDDHSCLMGNPLFGFDLAKMCYNAAKSWQIGWYADAEVDYKPLVIGNESWTGQLVGVAQYSHADRGTRPVTLRIDTGGSTDYFINFNRKIGMTSQNREGSDLVNVYEQGGNGESTGNASKILRNLNEGGEWTKSNFGNSGKTLSIKVNKIVLGDESIIGYADVTICLGTCNFGSPSISPSPSDAPSGSPSLRPTIISPSPTGNPTLSSSPTTEEDYKDHQIEVGSSNGQNSKTVELPFDNMLAFPQPINRRDFRSGDSFTAIVENKSLTITKIGGGSWSANFIARLVTVADSSAWREFTVGPSQSRGGNPYYVDLPEDDMRVIPYPVNSMLAWYGDTFDVEVTGKRLKVTRTDQDNTWAMNLKLYIASGRDTQSSPSSSPIASTSSPTTAPSSTPSSSPIASTSSPTTAPSSTPSSTTASPSSSPGKACFEEPSTSFFFKWKGKELTKKCFWLDTRANNTQRKAACAMQNNSVNDLPVASVACPETCDTCPKGPSSQPSPSPSISMAPSVQGDCSQNGSSRYLNSVNANNKKSWKTCNDLSAFTKGKIRSICSRDYNDGREAKYVCRVACETCPSECELRVMELEELNAALQKQLDDLEAKKKERM